MVHYYRRRFCFLNDKEKKNKTEDENLFEKVYKYAVEGEEPEGIDLDDIDIDVFEIPEEELIDDDGIVIEQYDDEPEEKKEDKESDNEDDESELCILCEKRPPNKSYGEDYDLCTQCRNSLIKSPIRFKGILALVGLLVCSFWGLLFLGSQITSLTAITEGYAHLENNKPQSAVASISTVSNMGWKTAANLIDVCYDLGTAGDVNYLATNYFYDKTTVSEDEPLSWADKAGLADINSPFLKDVKAKYDFITKINDYATTYSDLFYQHYEGIYYGSVKVEDVPYDDIIKQYTDMLAKAETDIEKGIINYYMLAISSVCEKDYQIQYNYCLNISELAPECAWMYRENLVDLAIKTGNYDVATKGIANLREVNPENVYTDLYEAILLRYQGKYDEAIAGFEALIATISEHEIYEVYYEALLCEFMMGDYEKAYEYASLCFNDEYYLSYETIYFYAMLSKQFGADSGYTAAADLLATNGEKLSPTVDKYINGEITAEQLFKNGEVVFE